MREKIKPSRKCPDCGKVLFYDNNYHKKRAAKKKSVCRDCWKEHQKFFLKEKNTRTTEKICACGKIIQATINQTDCKDCKKRKIKEATKIWKNNIGYKQKINYKRRKEKLKEDMIEYGLSSKDLQTFSKSTLKENPELLRALQIKNKIKNYEEH